jgi:formate-dependent nitrite reductase cytochrome c552 subunit
MTRPDTAQDGPSPAACKCKAPWAELVTVVEGRRLTGHPAATRGPIAALYRAYCASCGAEYPGPWRLDSRCDHRRAS